MNRIFFFLFMLIIGNVSAQQITFEKWYDTLGIKMANTVQETLDGGYILCGGRNDVITQSDAVVIKIDSLGNIVWAKAFGGNGEDRADHIEQAPDSGYLVYGVYDGGLNTKAWLFKLNANGTSLWSRTFMVDSTRTESMRMTLNNDLSCAVTGYIWPSTGFNSAYLVKRNSSGNAVWSKTYGGSNHTWAYDVSQTFDNGYALIGANRFNGAPDTYLIRVNSNGDTLWTKTYGGPNNDQGRSIQQTSDSGFIIAGYYYDTSLFNYDVYLIKTNAFGDTMWTKFIGDTTENTAESVALTNDGGYIISGTTYAPGSMNYYDVYLIKTDANGDTLWTKKFGGSNGPDYGFFVRQTKDGGYVISGQTQSFVFQGAPYLIKTDSMGNLVTGINKLGNIEPLIQVYPNPATNELMVSSSQFLIKHLEVLNVLGEKVSGINIINSKEVKLDVSPLPMGMYFVKVFTESASGGGVVTKKLVVE